MEARNAYFFRTIDYCAVLLTGTLTSFFVKLVVPPDWFMLFGMFTGMALGMVALIISIILFSRFSGLFEILMPGMLTAMIVGMASGMWVTMGDPMGGELMVFGFIVGFYLQGLFHLHDKSMHGEALQGNKTD